jgi:DNA-binding CsgD family transcriptional regulator
VEPQGRGDAVVSGPPASAVVGREEELGLIGAFLAGVEHGPAALVLSGEPGIGKTILWEAGVEQAQERFGRLLLHRSAEAEAQLAFAGLSDLLAAVFDDVAPTLAPLRRRALEVALLLAEPGDEPPDPRALGLALLDVLRALAQAGPVVIALDDVQWLDPSSAGVLQIALRRLRDEPVAVLATLRKLPGVAAAFQLERAFADERLERIWLGPLGLDALDRLLKDRLGLGLTRSELARVQETSGGNAFFALELGRELVRTGSRPVGTRALPVPESLQQLLGGRLARLPPETIEVVLNAAALARPTLELVTATHEDPERALAALDAAMREGVVELDGSRLRFGHPLLASVCYERAPLAKRRGVHRALADVVDDVEERARHLARATDGADPAVAAELRAAAEHAAARGATAAAAELCELAAELTPAVSAAERGRRLLEAAEFHRLAGDGDRAVALLERLLPFAGPGTERADVLYGLIVTMRGEAKTILDLCTEALAEVAGDDARASRILGHRVGAHLWRADARSALADARLTLQSAERCGDPALIATAIARTGTAEAYAAEITPGLLERGAEIEQSHGLVLEYFNSPQYALTRVRIRQGELDRPRTALEELEANAAARGDESTRLMVRWTLSMLEWLAGRWERSIEHARVAHELTEQSQHPHALGWVGRVKGLVEADLGLVDAARASAENGLAFARATANEFFAIMCLGTLGRIELMLGDLQAAAGYLRDVPARLVAGGLRDPTVPIWADAIETLVALGDLELADEYAARYEENAERLASPLGSSGAARSRGLLAAGKSELAQAVDAYDRALAAGDRYPLERARTLLCLGSAHRQAKQKAAARDALEQALAIFHELGARLWAEKARAELRRISGRRRASDDLTEMEERVAKLAAEGRSNKQIAAELFVSVHTVGAHLSRAYRKLEVGSRRELATRLAKAASDPVKPPSGAAKL